MGLFMHNSFPFKILLVIVDKEYGLGLTRHIAKILHDKRIKFVNDLNV